MTTQETLKTAIEYLETIGVSIEDFYSVCIHNYDSGKEVKLKGDLSNVNIELTERGQLAVGDALVSWHKNKRKTYYRAITKYKEVEIKITLVG